MYCIQCGGKFDDDLRACPFCGEYAEVETTKHDHDIVGDRSWIATLLLCFFFGFLGIHRFYTGNVVIGLIQMFSVGGCGLWAIIDFFMILFNSYRDANGHLLEK